jgi:hypothetical protein
MDARRNFCCLRIGSPFHRLFIAVGMLPLAAVSHSQAQSGAPGGDYFQTHGYYANQFDPAYRTHSAQDVLAEIERYRRQDAANTARFNQEAGACKSNGATTVVMPATVPATPTPDPALANLSEEDLSKMMSEGNLAAMTEFRRRVMTLREIMGVPPGPAGAGGASPASSSSLTARQMRNTLASAPGVAGSPLGSAMASALATQMAAATNPAVAQCIADADSRHRANQPRLAIEFMNIVEKAAHEVLSNAAVESVQIQLDSTTGFVNIVNGKPGSPYVAKIRSLK